MKNVKQMFGPGFLEKASKRIEVDKTMEKMSIPSHKEVAHPLRRQNMRMINQISAFFNPRAPLQSLAAGNVGANSSTILKQVPGDITRSQQNQFQIKTNQKNPSSTSSGPGLEQHPSSNLRTYSYFTSIASWVTPTGGTPQPLLR